MPKSVVRPDTVVATLAGRQTKPLALLAVARGRGGRATASGVEHANAATDAQPRGSPMPGLC